MSILNASEQVQGNFGDEMVGKLNPVKNFDEARAGIGRATDSGKAKVLSGIVKKFVKKKKAGK